MDVRILKLIHSFEENGWTSKGSVDVQNDWWFEDILLLSSKWRPVGTKIYLTLLTDPQEIDKKTIWCVHISPVIPVNRWDKSTKQILINAILKTDLKDFVKSINDVVLKSPYPSSLPAF